MAARTRSRLPGVDAARGVALLAMVAVHVLPGEDPDGTLSFTEHVASGRRLALLLRAVLVGSIGLGLGALDSGVAVVDNPELDRLGDPGQLVSDLLVTGYYPAVAWPAYLLLGLAVGRLALGRVRTPVGGEQELIAATGGPVVLDRDFFGNVPTGSRWWLAVDAPHTTTPLDLVGTAGAALLVLGVALILAPRLRLVLAPLAAAGSMPLSLYTAHVVVLLGLTETDDPERYYVVQVVVGVAAASAWRHWLGRGPLEAVLAAVTGPVAGRT